ncbi:HSP20-like chaperone, putative [Plasmodium malariae]|uniref:HSP20-like chaperone, putative n=1 Tax=Plasmodium malariae TaxID=5858 RepID=A0A1C3KEJ1_PLAMA|nr:HSP20-like chaperone, putative [Plasmodium malariae]
MVEINSGKSNVVIETPGGALVQGSVPIVLSTPVDSNYYSAYSYSTPVSSSYTSSHHNEYKYNSTKYMTKPQNNQSAEYIKTFERPKTLYYETIPLKSVSTNNIFEIAPSHEELSKITYNPKIEIYSTSDFVVIMMNLPGVSKENLQVELEKGLLRIFGHKYKPKIEELENPNEYHTKIIERVSEYYFCKIFQMPPAFSEEQRISCMLKDGELIIKILASQLKTQKRVIEIQ